MGRRVINVNANLETAVKTKWGLLVEHGEPCLAAALEKKSKHRSCLKTVFALGRMLVLRSGLNKTGTFGISI